MPDYGTGICQKYHGTACSQFLNNRSIYVRNENYQNIMEQKILQAFTVIVASPDISVQCNRYAISSLCYYVFPLCDEDVVTSSGSMISSSQPVPPPMPRKV